MAKTTAASSAQAAKAQALRTASADMQIAKDDEAVTARLAAGRSAERFPLSEALLTGMACGQSRVELSQSRSSLPKRAC